MLIFGYIVSEVKYRDLTEDIIQVVNKSSDCVINVPKLIIGLDNAKQYAFDNNLSFDILNHHFSNGDMWTFKKTEKREFYEEDLLEFRDYIINSIENQTIYYYINIFKLKYNKIKVLYNIFFNNSLNNNLNYFLIDDNMIYTSLKQNKVIGISFNDLNYININKDKIIEKLKSKPYNRVIYSTSKNMLELKNCFKGREYVIPAVFELNKKNHVED